MKNIFQKIGKVIKFCSNILIRLVLGLAYFALFFPVGIFFRMRGNFLGHKKEDPFWIQRPKIENVREFLSHQ